MPVIYARSPIGLIAIDFGLLATRIGAAAARPVEVEITETVASRALATYRRCPSGAIAIETGLLPVLIFLGATLFVAVLMTETVSSRVSAT